MTKKESIYNTEFGFTEDATVTLTGMERTMINNALANAAPKEVDVIPILTLMDKIARGGNA
jgi:hypothetical protein